jgi:hypothetical protein
MTDTNEGLRDAAVPALVRCSTPPQNARGTQLAPAVVCHPTGVRGARSTGSASMEHRPPPACWERADARNRHSVFRSHNSCDGRDCRECCSRTAACQPNDQQSDKATRTSASRWNFRLPSRNSASAGRAARPPNLLPQPDFRIRFPDGYSCDAGYG